VTFGDIFPQLVAAELFHRSYSGWRAFHTEPSDGLVCLARVLFVVAVAYAAALLQPLPVVFLRTWLSR
jgi:hypothetical protein